MEENVITLIEDFLCDKCDALFNDGISCDKVFNPEEQVNRAAFIRSVGSSIFDQTGANTYGVQIVENRKKRSECVTDAEILRNNFTKYGDVLANKFAIYISLQYITMPIKIVVGTSTVYTMSAQLNITVK